MAKFNMKSIVLLSMAVILTISLMNTVMATENKSGSTTASNTYMGVDADDAEAVKNKQDELNHEKWQQLFGDVDINDVEFTPDLDMGSVRELGGKLRDLLAEAIKLFVTKKPTSTTETPL